jgi:hypothetical protein
MYGLSGMQLRDFRHRGPTLDQFLKGQGFSCDTILAIRRVVAWRLADDMTRRGINKEELVRRVRRVLMISGLFWQILCRRRCSFTRSAKPWRLSEHR